MLYKDLVHFTPIETIIQLRDSENEQTAKNLVETYVISDTMANKLVDVAIPQLQLDNPQDNKGILVVGNYGTGKSHLMSVISAVAERSDLKEFLTNPKVKDASSSFAGKFKVLRVEIGSVTGSLRDILLAELETALKTWGVSFTFPSAEQVTNNKVALIQAVDAFREKYPDQGILRLFQLKEKLALSLGCSDFQQTPHRHDMVLDISSNPPDCIGYQPYPSIRVEFSNRHHQPDITLLDKVYHLESIMPVFSGDLHHKTQI